MFSFVLIFLIGILFYNLEQSIHIFSLYTTLKCEFIFLNNLTFFPPQISDFGIIIPLP